MAGSPHNNPPIQPPGSGQRRPTPQRIAFAVGEWVRSTIIVIIWAIALAAALTAGYLALQALLFFVNLAQRALGL